LDGTPTDGEEDAIAETAVGVAVGVAEVAASREVWSIPDFVAAATVTTCAMSASTSIGSPGWW